MVRAFSRFHRLTAAVAVILVAMAGTTSVAVYAQSRQAASAERRPDFLVLFEAAEKDFGAALYKTALTKYQELLSKHGSKLFPEQKAVVQLRIATCHFYLKEWPQAEKALLEFLDKQKYPNGTGELLDPQNNYRGVAMITLADVYSSQEKWDPAIELLYQLGRPNAEIRLQDRTRSVISLTRVLEAKNKSASEDVVKKVAQDSLEMLKPIIASRNYVVPEIKDAANRMVELYTKLGAVKEAQALQDEMSAQISGSPIDIAVANFQRIEIGDSLFDQAESEGDTVRSAQIYRQALSSYQETLRRSALSHIIEEGIKMKEEEETRIKQAYPNPNDAQKELIAKVSGEKENFLKIAETFKNNKDYDAFISFRIGLCLLKLKRPWEAYIAFRDIFDNSPGFSQMSTAYFYYIRTLKDIHRNKEAQEACREFMQKFPSAEEIGDVAVLSGEISFEAGDFDEAVKQFRWARENVKSLTLEYKEWIDWYVCAALFANVEWEQARDAIEKFISNYPKSQQMEQMVYMRGLCYFFQGKYPETMAGFDDYLTKYPDGEYKPDARYRLALVKFGLNPPQNEDTIKRCLDWLTDYANPPAKLAEAVERQRPEIYTLLGDVYFRYYEDKNPKNTDALKKANLQKAIDYYITAAKGARNNEQTLEFVTRDLNKRLPSLGEWAKMLDLYVTLYNWDQDDPKALGYLYWILRSSEKLGKTIEEKRIVLAKANVEVPEEFISKSAEEILSDAIIRNINDPKKENVEQLITELAGRVTRKARAAQRREDAEKIDPEEEILNLLKLKDGQGSLIAQARSYYARAEIARGMRNVERREDNLQRIVNIFKPEELSPTILGVSADYLLAKKDYQKADAYFQYILDHFRSSDFADYGFAGKGEVLLHEGKNKEALALFKEAIDNDILLTKEREIRIGYAQALFETGDLEKAGEAFKAIAANRAWRGEGTAWALYYLGQIEERRGQVNEAINYYRRCFLAWKKHGNITAKAYLRTATLFKDRGDIEGARGTLTEMLQPENPASKEPEAAQARQLQSQLS